MHAKPRVRWCAHTFFPCVHSSSMYSPEQLLINIAAVAVLFCNAGDPAELSSLCDPKPHAVDKMRFGTFQHDACINYSSGSSAKRLGEVHCTRRPCNLGGHYSQHVHQVCTKDSSMHSRALSSHQKLQTRMLCSCTSGSTTEYANGDSQKQQVLLCTSILPCLDLW